MKKVLNIQESMEFIQGIKIEVVIHLIYYVVFPFILLRSILKSGKINSQFMDGVNDGEEKLLYQNLIMNTILKTILYNQVLSLLAGVFDVRVMFFRWIILGQKSKQREKLEMMTQIQLNEHFTPPEFLIDKYIIILLQIFSMQILSISYSPINLMVSIILMTLLFFVAKFYLLRYTKWKDVNMEIINYSLQGPTMFIICVTSFIVYIIHKELYLEQEVFMVE